MILQVGVKAFLRNKEGKYLLIKRSPVKYPEVPNPWDIVGGRIDPGTTLMDNLKREVKEETGLEIVSEPRLVAARTFCVSRGSTSCVFHMSLTQTESLCLTLPNTRSTSGQR